MNAVTWILGAAVAVSISAGGQSALDAIASYEFGQSRVALKQVEAMVVAAVDTPQQYALANDLVALLASDATLECKRFVLRQLAMIATDAQVGALASYLLDRDLSDMARYALQPIADDSVDRALLDALGSRDVPTTIQVGLITSLGARGTARAVRTLNAHAKSDDPAVARAAFAALGRIGTPRAARALASVKSRVAEDLRGDVSHAQLAAADAMFTTGRADRARTVYEALVAREEPDAVRKAAFIGLVNSGGLDDAPETWRARLDQDPILREAAAGYLHRAAARYATMAEQQTAR